MKSFSRKGLMALALCAAAFSVRGDAYDVKPMVIQLQPSGSRSASTMVVTNTHDVPVAIEIHSFRRTQKPDGTDDLVSDEKDLIITPPQMVIAPKSSQTVRVQWIGEQNPERELAYRIITEQLPIDFKKTKRNDFTADLKVKYRYEVALYIAPKNPKSSASLISAKPVAGPGGAREIELTIGSDGNARAILDKPELRLTSANGATVKLEGAAIQPLIGLNILPGSKRVVRIAAPANLGQDQITGSLSSEYIAMR